MPFNRYLYNATRDDQLPPTPVASSSSTSSPPSNLQDYAHHHQQHASYSQPLLATHANVTPSQSYSSPIHFQVPHFMLDGLPPVAPGGGAEVLPPNLIASPGSVASSWFANNGYYQKPAEDTYSAPTGQKYYSTADVPASEYVPNLSNPLSSNYTSSHFNPLVHNAVPSPLQSLTSPPTLPLQAAPPSSGLQENYALMPVQSWDTQSSLSAPSSLGLPVYSSSGFDLLSLLGRIATRPNPTITLGPVDMSCSFVVVDVRRYDSPIVYASPSFYRLTGYTDKEVLGRNCRFLQSPDGQVSKGDRRQHPNAENIALLRKCLASDKECQTSLTNYKKGGSAFINLVTVIPVPPLTETDDVIFHVGFQVDLTEQPNAILQKLRDGSYITNYNSSLPLLKPQISSLLGRDKRHQHYPMNAISQDLHKLLKDPAFVAASTLDVEDNGESNEGNHPLSLLLLHAMPDFILVLSLKGAFLYVAPAIKRVLGYDPAELVGQNIKSYCHPADVVPLERELKESSNPPGPQESGFGQPGAPRAVNVLFRARAKDNAWTWIECTGRLHAEPGKGRKAIILSARPRAMPSLDWSLVPLPEAGAYETEVWGILSADATVLFMGTNIINMLGWGVGEIIGMCVGDFVDDASGSRHALEDALRRTAELKTDAPECVDCTMRKKTGEHVELTAVVYPLPRKAQPHVISQMRPIICQLRSAGAGPVVPRGPNAGPQGDMFAEFDTEREASWHVELQQLKIENQRLVDEIREMEKTIEGQEQQIAAVARPQEPPPVLQPPMPRAHMHAMEPAAHTMPEWMAALQHHQNLGKRRWEP